MSKFRNIAVGLSLMASACTGAEISGTPTNAPHSTEAPVESAGTLPPTIACHKTPPQSQREDSRFVVQTSRSILLGKHGEPKKQLEWDGLQEAVVLIAAQEYDMPKGSTIKVAAAIGTMTLSDEISQADELTDEAVKQFSDNGTYTFIEDLNPYTSQDPAEASKVLFTFAADGKISNVPNCNL